MGKAAFVHLSDGVSRLQIYIRKADIVGIRNDAEGGDVGGAVCVGHLLEVGLDGGLRVMTDQGPEEDVEGHG